MYIHIKKLVERLYNIFLLNLILNSVIFFSFFCFEIILLRCLSIFPRTFIHISQLINYND